LWKRLRSSQGHARNDDDDKHIKRETYVLNVDIFSRGFGNGLQQLASIIAAWPIEHLFN